MTVAAAPHTLSRGWTKRRLAEERRLCQKYISEQGRAHKEPKWETLDKLAQGLDVD